MVKFNGHRNWAHWNVALWINNDENLYHLARECIDQSANRTMAVKNLIGVLDELGITETPDGAKYSISAIRAAMVGM